MLISASHLTTDCHLYGRWTIKQINDIEVLYTPLLGAMLISQISGCERLIINVEPNQGPMSPSQYFAWRIDHGPWQRVAAVNRQLVVKLDGQAHTLWLMTAGNCDADNVWTGDEGFAINSIQLQGPRPIIQPSPLTSPVTVIGDSITAGCWVAGSQASMDYRPESNFVGLAQDILKMPISRIAYSAAGVLRPATGMVPPAPKWLNQLDAFTPAPQINSPLTVVALGVNDRRYGANAFASAYYAYVQQVQKQIHGQIALMVPFAQSFANIIEQTGSRLGMPVIKTAGWCQQFTDHLHPNQESSQTAAKHFAASLRHLLQ